MLQRVVLHVGLRALTARPTELLRFLGLGLNRRFRTVGLYHFQPGIGEQLFRVDARRGPMLDPWGRLWFEAFLLWRGLDLRLERALGISLLKFCFPGPAQRFFTLQGLFRLMRSMYSLPPTLGVRLATRPLLIPAASAVAPGPIAAAPALFVAIPFGPLLLRLWWRLLSLMHL